MSDPDQTQTPAATDEEAETRYEQHIDEASGVRVGPPATGETDDEAVRAGDQRWEQARGSH
jgi:hypothetical protein